MERQIVQDFSPLLRIYSDGEVERLSGTATLPPSLHHKTSNVLSKDIHTPSVRLYIPKSAINRTKKLPVLIYFHGGAFCLETAASPTYHNYLNSLVSEAYVIAVSVDYRRAPEFPLPAAYDDSWAAITWVASHSSRGGGEEWLNIHADMERVFFGGDSAGANIAHHMGIRFGEENNQVCGMNMKLLGVVLVHPYFMGSSDPVGADHEEAVSGPDEKRLRELLVRLWHLASPTTTGCDDPMINPAMDPKLSKMGCRRVLVFVAERATLSERERRYKEQLISSGWDGVVEAIETQDEGHLFHLLNPTSPNALVLMQHFVSFISQH